MQNLFVIKAGQHLDQIMGDDSCQECAESTTHAYENVRAVLYGRDAYLIFSEMLTSLHEAQQAQVNKVQLDGENISHIFGFEIDTISEYNNGTRIFFNAKAGFDFF